MLIYFNNHITCIFPVLSLFVPTKFIKKTMNETRTVLLNADWVIRYLKNWFESHYSRWKLTICTPLVSSYYFPIKLSWNVECVLDLGVCYTLDLPWLSLLSNHNLDNWGSTVIFLWTSFSNNVLQWRSNLLFLLETSKTSTLRVETFLFLGKRYWYLNFFHFERTLVISKKLVSFSDIHCIFVLFFH